jgi:putative endonuclease
MSYFVYILQCSDQTLYTGYTDDRVKRVKTHNDKKWAKYTRWRTPVEIVYSETFETKSEAMKRENEIKKMPRIKKLDLIKN